MNIESVYRAADREIRSALLGIDLANFNEMKAQQIISRTRSLIAALHVAAERWTETDLMAGYRKGARKAKVALEILGKKPVKRQYTAPEMGIKDDAFAVLFRANTSIMKTVSQYLSLASQAARSYAGVQAQMFNFDTVRAEIEDIAEEANVEGTPPGRLSVIKHRTGLPGKISAILKDSIMDGGFIEINGRHYRIKKYIELVVQTELRDAATDATLDLCDQYENDLVEVSDHGTICEICKPFEGKVFSISGNTPGYAKLTKKPTFHPRCQHSILPTSQEAIDIRREYA